MSDKKRCNLYDRECIQCGECDLCDLFPGKKCDNCGKCIEITKDYESIPIDKITIPKTVSPIKKLRRK